MSTTRYRRYYKCYRARPIVTGNHCLLQCAVEQHLIRPNNTKMQPSTAGHCPMQPNTTEHFQVTPSTTQYRQVPLFTAGCSQVPQSATEYSQVQPNTGECDQMPQNSFRYLKILPRTRSQSQDRMLHPRSRMLNLYRDPRFQAQDCRLNIMD